MKAIKANLDLAVMLLAMLLTVSAMASTLSEVGQTKALVMQMTK